MHNVLSPSNLLTRRFHPCETYQTDKAGSEEPDGCVEKYEAGKLVQFRFTAPRGFNGVHRLEVLQKGAKETELRHTIERNTEDTALLSWPILVRPLHNALVEDALTLVEEHLDLEKHVKYWSVYVRVLRWIVSGGKSGRQSFS